MAEEIKTIDFSKDKKMVRFSDRLLGYGVLIGSMNEDRGKLSREMVNHVKEKYGVDFNTHIIDCYDLELRPRKRGE